jgi:hypothetical protein
MVRGHELPGPTSASRHNVETPGQIFLLFRKNCGGVLACPQAEPASGTFESVLVASGLGLILWWIFKPLLTRERVDQSAAGPPGQLQQTLSTVVASQEGTTVERP